MQDPSPLDQLKKIATEIQQIDVACYDKYQQDHTAPILGLGKPDARWCFFGRDPGECEVKVTCPL